MFLFFVFFFICFGLCLFVLLTAVQSECCLETFGNVKTYITYYSGCSSLCPDLLSTYISPVLDLDPNDVHVPGAITKEGLKSIVCVFGGGWEGN